MELQVSAPVALGIAQRAPLGKAGLRIPAPCTGVPARAPWAM